MPSPNAPVWSTAAIGDYNQPRRIFVIASFASISAFVVSSVPENQSLAHCRSFHPLCRTQLIALRQKDLLICLARCKRLQGGLSALGRCTNLSGSRILKHHTTGVERRILRFREVAKSWLRARICMVGWLQCKASQAGN